MYYFCRIASAIPTCIFPMCVWPIYENASLSLSKACPHSEIIHNFLSFRNAFHVIQTETLRFMCCWRVHDRCSLSSCLNTCIHIPYIFALDFHELAINWNQCTERTSRPLSPSPSVCCLYQEQSMALLDCV